MSLQEAYTPEEWLILKDTPVVAVSAIMTAGRAGLLQVILEAHAMSDALAHPEGYGPFIEELANHLSNETEEESANHVHLSTPAEVKPKALQMCREAVVLLERKAPGEVENYKKWVMFIAYRVARAAKEGGFLGIGAKRISHNEQIILNDLATALGYNSQDVQRFWE